MASPVQSAGVMSRQAPERQAEQEWILVADSDRQFARRYTFYIDPTGKIADIDKAVKPASSGQDIVTHLEALKVPARK